MPLMARLLERTIFISDPTLTTTMVTWLIAVLYSIRLRREWTQMPLMGKHSC